MQYNFGEFFHASVVPLHHLYQNGWLDDNVAFFPTLAGFQLPEYVEKLLRPFTSGMVCRLY